MKITHLLCLTLLLTACGYKGALYLPKENDKARFGVIQTGIDFKNPNTNSSSPTLQQDNQ